MDSEIEVEEEETKEEIETEEEKNKKIFENQVQTIIEKLEKLPSVASEIKIPNITLDCEEVYKKLCRALKVPTNYIFLSNFEKEKFDLSYQSLGPVAIIPVTKTLTLCKEIKILDLKYNNLGSESLPAITSLLDQNENISQLNLSSNGIGKGSARLLSELIAHCYSIEFLDLSSNDLGDEELQEIGLALMKVDSVKELNLNSNDFSSANAPLFGSFISKCSALLKLDLSCCHLEEGAGNIFSGLKFSNMTSLNLSRNGIPDEAMSMLATGLKPNKSLKNLNLSYNSISKKGAVALAPGLKGNTTLEVINLAYNPMQGSAASVLLNSVGGNLKVLDLSGIKVNLAFLKTLNSYTKAGKEVKVLFGSETRYDCFPRDFETPVEDNVDEKNVIPFLEKMAENKGVSLRNALKSIHAHFINESQAATADEKKTAKRSEEEKLNTTTEMFARELATSSIAVPKALALQISELLSKDGCVDMWDLLSKLQWKIDDLRVKVKAPTKSSPETKKEKKK